MSEFKQSVETKTVEPLPEDAVETPGAVSGDTEIPKAENIDTEDRLDVWETEHKRAYAQDYFKIRETAHTFPISAQYKYIDKFVKDEMKNREYNNTKENYESIIREIEQEIGTEKTETYTRLRRIFEYIKVLNKYREAKLKKESYSKLYKEYREL